jgi:hypothetical protein
VQVAVSGGDAESPLFRMIDDTKPVIEFTELKDSEDNVIWQTGQGNFEVPENGILKVHGLCRKEYLPADTYINIGFNKVGWAGIKWISEGGSSTPDQTQAQQWLLQPSDLWSANDSNSPVAEFEVEITCPLQDSIVVQATNPAGVKSDSVYLTQKPSWYFVLADDNEQRLYFVHAERALKEGTITNVVQFVFDPVDENYNQITEYINGLDGLYYCYNNKIRAYDINGYPAYVIGNRYERSTGSHIPQSIEGNSYFMEGNKKWYLDSNDNITEVDKMWNFNPPETWVEDTSFNGKGLYDGYAISNNKLKRFSKIDYGLWEIDLPWTGTGLSYRGSTKSGYTGLFYFTDKDHIYETEIKNPGYIDPSAVSFSKYYAISNATIGGDFYSSSIVYGLACGTTRYFTNIEKNIERFEKSRALFYADLTNFRKIKWAYVIPGKFEGYKIKHIGYFVLSPFIHTGVDFLKFNHSDNVYNVFLGTGSSYDPDSHIAQVVQTVFQQSGELIFHVDYPNQNIMEYANINFDLLDITSFLNAGEINYFGIKYPGENVEIVNDGAIVHSITGIQYNFYESHRQYVPSTRYFIKILGQTEGQDDSSLDVLRTISAEGLNINAIGIIQPSQIPQIQIRGSSTVRKGQNIQLRTVGVAPISWTVSDDAMATIDESGLLTGLDAGSITITATDAVGQTAIKQITIDL